MIEPLLKEKLDNMHEDIKDNGKKTDALFDFIHVGNGQPPLKMQVDRNSRSLRVLLWAIGVTFASAVGAVFKYFCFN